MQGRMRAVGTTGAMEGTVAGAVECRIAKMAEIGEIGGWGELKQGEHSWPGEV